MSSNALVCPFGLRGQVGAAVHDRGTGRPLPGEVVHGRAGSLAASGQSRAARQPAALAWGSVQNQRSPFAVLIFVAS